MTDERESLNEALKGIQGLKDEQGDLLYRYSVWLEDNGYLDSDWWSEEPTAMDRFLEK